MKCDTCGGLIRPDVVWFGEMLPEKALQNADNIAKNSDVFFSIGTSAEVYPAAILPIIAKSPAHMLLKLIPNQQQFRMKWMRCFRAKAGKYS